MKGFQPNSNFSHLPSSILSTSSPTSSFQLPTSSLLNKRAFQYHEDFSDKDITKKLKIAQDSQPNEYSALEEPLKLQNIYSKILPSSFLASSDLHNQLLNTLLQQQIQTSNLNHYLHLLTQSSRVPLMVSSFGLKNQTPFQFTESAIFNQSQKKDLNEHLKLDSYCEETTDSQAETTQVTEKDFDDDEKLSEASTQGKKMPLPRRIINTKKCEDAPILAEFTMQFPDWDLSTIFDFLKSGKSLEVYESERKVRTSRKLGSIKQKKVAKQAKNLKTEGSKKLASA